MKKSSAVILFVLAGALLLGGCRGGKQRFAQYPEPPGVRLVSGLFVDESEIAVIDYKEFLYKLKEEGRLEEYARMQPNIHFPGEDSVAQMLNTSYYAHHAFQIYPMVGITREQAEAYCAWRSAEVNKGLEESGRFRRFFAKHPDAPRKVRYRLPTPDEWERIARARAPHNALPGEIWGPANERAARALAEHNETWRMPQPVESSLVERGPNGLHHMFGNVAEMTAKPGVAMGGSYLESPEAYAFGKKYRYDAPQHWLGFRCVAEFVNE